MKRSGIPYYNIYNGSMCGCHQHIPASMSWPSCCLVLVLVLSESVLCVKKDWRFGKFVQRFLPLYPVSSRRQVSPNWSISAQSHRLEWPTHGNCKHKGYLPSTSSTFPPKTIASSQGRDNRIQFKSLCSRIWAWRANTWTYPQNWTGFSITCVALKGM